MVHCAPTWLRRFRGSTGSRVYKTSDLLRYISGGTIMRYIKRKDTQVEIDGQQRMEVSA